MTVTGLFSRSRPASATQGTNDPVFGDGAPGSAALSRPAVADLFYRVRCAIFRMHDYQVKVVPGHVCLACHHCGKRSLGWAMSPPMGVSTQSATVVRTEPVAPALEALPMRMAKVLHHAPRAQQQKRAAAN
jgi:hypothetical protein